MSDNEVNTELITDMAGATTRDITRLRSDLDPADPRAGVKIAAERLSIVRYVFLVQIEDGIATAGQRAALEYADAVLIGWPEEHSDEVADLDEQQLAVVREQMRLMERHLAHFTAVERAGNIDEMTDALVRVTECVARVRGLYQPGFALPTFAEIRRVVQDEWDEDMGKIDPDGPDDTTADVIERQTEEADRLEDESGKAAA